MLFISVIILISKTSLSGGRWIISEIIYCYPHLQVTVIFKLLGVLFWFIVYPIDTMKTIIQTNSVRDKTVSIRDTFQDILNNRGLKGFFTGLTPTIFRSIIANIILLNTNEYSHSVFDKYTV